MRNNKSGMALLPILLIFVVVGLIASFLVKNQGMDIRLTSNLIEQVQAQHYAIGAETQAREILLKDLEANKIDHIKEDWYGRHVMKLKDAQVSYVIEDMQGRFNLNTLIKAKEVAEKNGNKVTDKIPEKAPVEENNKGEQVANDKGLNILTNILKKENISEKTADAFMDWLDADDIVRPNGAEDREYIVYGTQPFYKTGDGMIMDISEMRLIRGIDANIYTRLIKSLVALPSDATKININTAPDYIIKAAISNDADLEAVTQAKRKNYIDKAELGKILPRNEIFGVTSEYFIVYVKAHYGNADVYTASLLYREPGKENEKGQVKVIWRKFVKRFDI